MKSSIYALFLCVLTTCAFAQQKKLFVYGELGGGGGNFASFKAGINGIYDHVAFGITHYSQWANADNVPPDYNSGLVIIGSKIPQQTLNTACFTAGYVFFTSNDHVRFIAKGGLAFGTYTAPDYYTRVTPGWFDSNYDITFKEISTVGLLINPTLELPLGAAFGFSGGLWANLNPTKSSFGAEGNIIFGRLRTRRRH